MTDNIKEINNGLHSLYVIPRSEEYTETKDGNHEKREKHNLYRLYIQEFLGGSDDKSEKHKINDIFNELQESKSENDKLEIRIASNGGYINELMRFENVISTKFKGRTTTILDNHGYSCGAKIFLKGDKRLVHKDSYIMFHYYSGGAYGKGGDIKAKIDFQSKAIEKMYRERMKPYFSKKEIDELITGKDYRLDADEMIKRGIATAII